MFIRKGLVCKVHATLFLSLTVSLSLPVLAKTIHVPAGHPTIQKGINAAADGDTVLVSAGTYYENINFSGKAITVTSVSGPAATIIDGSKGNYAPTVLFDSGEQPTSVLSGFTIKNGYSDISISGASPTIQGNIILGGSTYNYNAAGILIQPGSAIIKGNLISGAAASGIQTYYSAGSQISGNLIANNASVGISDYYSGGNDAIQQNTIVGNIGGGVSYYGFGTYQLTMVQNLIYANSATGVALVGNGAPVSLISNAIVDNQNECCGSGSEVQLDQFNASTTIQNNLIVATGDSSAFSCQSYLSDPVFTNNDVFAANSAAYSGSCPDPTGTHGNLSADPLFIDALSDNYLLQSGSPAVNAGSNSAPGEPATDFVGNTRILDDTIDIGAYEYAATNSLTLSTYSLRFTPQNVGTTSAAQSITLTNNSSTAVSLTMIAAGSNYSQTNNCGTSLAAGAHCEISVSFAPLGGGSLLGVVGIFTGETVNPLTINLRGTGLAPQVQFGGNFYFYDQIIGTSATQTGTLTNVGQAPLTIGSIAFSGATDFVESNNCPIAPKTLAIGAACTVSVTYSPTIIGQESGTITVTDNAIPNTQSASVYGSSVSAGAPTVTPTSLTFPTTLIGQSSGPQTATLTNTGTGPMGIQTIYSYNDFVETNNCPSTLAAGASCTISVTFTPNAEGLEYGYVYIYTDSASSTTLSMSGTGQAPVPAITSLSITSVPAGSVSAQLTINGSGFVGGSQVLWNGVTLPCCSYESGGTQITVNIPEGNMGRAGTYPISVFTPTPGGGTSNSLPFVVYAPINYAVKSAPYNYVNITGTNLELYYYSGATITSPFPIQFGGGSYTNLTVGGGGTISFNGFYSPYNDVIPTTQTPMLVAPFWSTLQPFGSGDDNNVFWAVTGSAPNRELVVEWRDVAYCCSNSPQNTVTFEVVFFEGNGNILFNYADTIFGGSYSKYDNGATATSGVQVAPGVGKQYSHNRPSLKSNTALLWYPSSSTATLSSGSLGFGYHQIGTTSLQQKLTLTNGGVAPLKISSITIDNPDFSLKTYCPATLQSQKSCVIHVFFTPSEPSAETGTLTVVDNATNAPQTASLTGIGTITQIVVYPITANFGNVKVGTTSSIPVVLANASNQPLTIQEVTASPSVYTQSSNCGASLAAGASCTVSVTFAPTQQGNVSGTIAMGLNHKKTVAEVQLLGSGQ